jgi:solute carrier family 25 oxoglutarate transporter 11
MDLLKTRMQLSGEGGGKVQRSTFQVVKAIVKADGVLSLWTGLSAALARQITYTGTRLGVFQYLCDQFQGELTLKHRIAFGIVAGASGAVVGNVTEVALVRMTSDKQLPPDQRRNYRHVGSAVVSILKHEGISGMFRGLQATVSRAMLLNAAQLGTYSQAKHMLLKHHPTMFESSSSLSLHCISGLAAGLMCTIVSLPADIAKTRLQQMRPRPDGTLPYSGMLGCLMQISRHEGVLAMWKGFLPYFLRLGPHTILSFIFLEQLNKSFSKSSM